MIVPPIGFAQPHVLDTATIAFVNATGISNRQQIRAINKLVVGLKSAGLWNKMIALYPFVGGTADTHKYNLIDTSTFTLGYNGTITHNENGITGDGSTGWANSYINPSVDLSQNDVHVSYFVQNVYQRDGIEIGASNWVNAGVILGAQRNVAPAGNFQSQLMDGTNDYVSSTTYGSYMYITATRQAAANYYMSINKNHTLITRSSVTRPNRELYVLAYNGNASPTALALSNRTLSFLTVGSGLSTSEVEQLVDLNLEFQNNLNRYWDEDALAFLSATGITDGTQSNAINGLVKSLKRYGLWDKFDAVYPFVGGTATTHKYNLINPLDSDSAFRLTFSGTITHNANGITPDGTTGYADTNMNAQSELNGGNAQDDAHAFLYLYSTSARAGADFGCSNASPGRAFNMNSRNAFNSYNSACMTADINDGTGNTATSGVYAISRISSANYIKAFNTTQNTIARASATPPDLNIILAAQNRDGVIQNFQNRTYSFFTLGSGLTGAEMTTLYEINRTYQRELGRFV